MAIREGKWDCRNCGQKGNRGPNTYCGACGSPRPDDVEFYLPDDAEEVTDQNLIDEAMSGADWICPYCSTQNNAFDSYCVACGNQNSADQKNKQLEEKEILFDQPPAEEPPPPSPKGVLKKILIGAVTVIAGLIIFTGLSQIESDIDLKVKKLSYKSSISFEEYRNVKEEDWTIPQGADSVTSFRAIHHYDKIPDGFITKTRNVKVKIGEKKVKVGTKDMGNGYFKDIYRNKPVYETRMEKYKEQIYRKVPVYRQKYRYFIMKWIQSGPFENKGEGKKIIFARDPLNMKTENLRNIKKDIKYYITAMDNNGETYTGEVNGKIWSKSSVNGEIKGSISTLFRYFKEFK